MAPIIQLLIALCILAVVYWAVWALPLPQIVRVIATVVISLAGLAWCARIFGVRMPW